MNTPLYDALRILANRQTARFHMPGHKGQPVLGEFSSILPFDFTEVYDTGNLYTGEGPIFLAECEAARLYDAADCHFLTGGSSQGVHTMLYAAVGAGGQVLFDRNCHKSSAHAAALLDLTPHFIFPDIIEPFGIPGLLDPQKIDDILTNNQSIEAVLITSPNYYGVCQDIPTIAQVCHTHHVPLLVDAAHGAHFPAVGLDSPIKQGATLAVLSAHKTLYALGQSAILLSDGTIHIKQLRQGAALFGTSSPSYAMLVSLDLARAALEQNHDYLDTAQAVAALRNHLATHTCFLPFDLDILDPCRLTVSCVGTAWTGHMLADILYHQFGIACEMSDLRNIVCIVTPADLSQNLSRLRNALDTLSITYTPAPFPNPLPLLPTPSRVLSVRESLLSTAYEYPLADISSGMICARPVTPYPPGVPILWPGEEIKSEHIVFLHNQCYNTVDHIAVVQE